MKERYNETFNKVKMNESRKDEIKNMIRDESTMKQSPIKRYYILAAAAVIIASIFVIPPTRNMAMAAARYIKNKLSFRSGIEIEYTSPEPGAEAGTIQQTTVSLSTDDKESINKYTESENDKLYYLDGNKKIDITNKCSEETYYKTSYKMDNGNTSTIYIGGTADNNGWIEFSYDKSGKCITQTNYGNTKGASWAEQAINDSGVKNNKDDSIFVEIELEDPK